MATVETKPLPNMLRVRDVADYLDICTRVAYQLVKTPGFPLVIAGDKSFRIPRDAFLAWLEEDPPVKKLHEYRAQQQGRQP
jgi:excisionase family DNA binding protein